MDSNQENPVVVIGGGIIGVCCAYYLSLAGKSVVIIEKGDLGSGCSYGNVGLLALSHCVPLATPGVLKKAMKWILRPDSPFYIQPRFDPALAAWLLRFAAACNVQRMRYSTSRLCELAQASIALYEQLANADRLEFGYEHSGLLGLFRTQEGLKEGRAHAALLNEFGVEAREVPYSELSAIEPAVRPGLAGAVYFPGDRSLIPPRFIAALSLKAVQQGVRIHTQTEVTGVSCSGDRAVAVQTSRGEFQASTVVIAAGAWSSQMARFAGINLPLQAGKGYSVAVARADWAVPLRPTLLGEAHVLLTPMGDTTRIGGTMEMAGMDLSINRRRSAAIFGSVHDYLVGAEDLNPGPVWSGLRPCTPDSLPIVGWSSKLRNVMLATGHGMLGVTLGPITGKIVSEHVCKGNPEAARPVAV